MNSDDGVVVVGAGWAGLSAAVHLAAHGEKVTVLEASRQLGGRARCVRFGDLRVDNGQHLMLGAYRRILQFVRLLGIEENSVFLRRRLRLSLRSPAGGIDLNSWPLSAPLNLLFGVIFASGLAWRQKSALLAGMRRLFHPSFELSHDQSVLQLLHDLRQPQRLIEALWSPLCLAALNTAIDRASAQVFANVLRTSFAFHSADSDFLFQRTDLGSAITGPALDFIERHDGKVELGQRVVGLQVDNDRVSGVVLPDEIISARQVVLAVPHWACQQLLAPVPALAGIAEKLARIGTSPICTVYLQYPPDVRLETEMVGLLDSVSQWLFDRRVCGQPGLMSVVISADGPHLQMPKEQLATLVTTELACLFPEWPAPQQSLVIREKRATFDCRTGVSALRPGVETPLSGCWLAGDYTNTGLPATLEGAVHSGIECAERILGWQKD